MLARTRARRKSAGRRTGSDRDRVDARYRIADDRCARGRGADIRGRAAYSDGGWRNWQAVADWTIRAHSRHLCRRATAKQYCPSSPNAARRYYASSKPILHIQAADTFELAGIGGHDRGAGRIGVGGDQQVVAADRLSGRFELRADSAVFRVSGFAEQVFDSLEQPFRA